MTGKWKKCNNNLDEGLEVLEESEEEEEDDNQPLLQKKGPKGVVYDPNVGKKSKSQVIPLFHRK